MGKSYSTMVPFDAKNSLLTKNILWGIQKQVHYEYPFLNDEWRSMVITDAYHPDNIIVYASDLFEETTGYKKSDIVGQNCGFLQGVMTDPKAKELIREAIRMGVPCDVEILNFTKNGIPFWNNLIILPVHRQRKKSGKVRYFIGIQQEVSYLKYSPNPLEWTAPEVATWLGKVGIGYLHQYTKEVVTNAIDGEKLLSMDVDDYPWIDPQHKETLVEMIQQLKDNPMEYFKSEKKLLEDNRINLKRFQKDIDYLYRISEEKQWKKSKKTPKFKTLSSEDISLNNLEYFPEQKKQFLKYLTSIYCVHLYEFIEQMKDMKQYCDDDKEAWRIYEKFFVENEFRLMNVGTTTVYSMGHLLDSAYEEVMNMVVEHFKAWQLEYQKES